MDLLKSCAEVYRKYIGYNYTFVLDCGIDIDVEFRAQYFYHLAGLHYLTDIAQVDRNKANNSPVSIFKRILNDKINDELIKKSKFYTKIHDRLIHFLSFDDLMTAKLLWILTVTKLTEHLYYPVTYFTSSMATRMLY